MEILGRPVVRSVAVFQYLRGVVDAIIQQRDLDAVGRRVGELLDESLVVDRSQATGTGGPEFRITQSGRTWDLSKINFEKLKEEFGEAKHKNIQIADLRAFIQHKLIRCSSRTRPAPHSRSGYRGLSIATTPALPPPTTTSTSLWSSSET